MYTSATGQFLFPADPRGHRSKGEGHEEKELTLLSALQNETSQLWRERASVLLCCEKSLAHCAAGDVSLFFTMDLYSVNLITYVCLGEVCVCVRRVCVCPHQKPQRILKDPCGPRPAKNRLAGAAHSGGTRSLPVSTMLAEGLALLVGG